MKQICIFPYAPHSSERLNAKAYPVQLDGRGRPDFYIVWSPVHIPHYVGHYATQESAQKRADKINAMGSFVYGKFPPKA